MKIHLLALAVPAFCFCLSLPAAAHKTDAEHVHAIPVSTHAPELIVPEDEDAAASEDEAEAEGEEAAKEGAAKGAEHLPSVQGAPGIGAADKDTMGEGE